MRFDDSDIAAVYRAIFERRDMRHFTPAPVVSSNHGSRASTPSKAPAPGRGLSLAGTGIGSLESRPLTAN